MGFKPLSQQNIFSGAEQLALDFDASEYEVEPEVTAISAEDQRRRNEAAKLAFEQLAADGAGKKPEWYETYQQLRSLKYPWRVACYIAWAASPKLTRWPDTQDDLARQVLGLNSDRVIATWRKKSPEINEVIGILQAAPMLEHRADVLKALALSASKEDHRSNPDRKLFLEITGDYVPHAKIDLRRNGEVDDLSTMSEDELLKAAKKARGEA